MTRFLISIFVLLYSGTLMAATAIVQTVAGNVTAAIGGNAPVALAQNSSLDSGMTVTTGANSHIVMKFEDEQVIVLKENTTFKIGQYRFDRTEPKKSTMFFSLLRGALRSVSGLIGQQAPETYRLQTPVATIGIRGTDFMAATGSLYTSVGQGTISVSSQAATMTFNAGQIGFVSAAGVAPSAIALSQLPPHIAASFGQLGSIGIPAGTGGATGSASQSGYAGGSSVGGTAGVGGTAAKGAGVGGMSTTAVVGSVAAVAAVAAVATNNNPTAAAATTTVTAP